MSDPKTPEQLRREIAYFAAALQRTKSENSDRAHRLRAAIARSEQELEEAIRVRAASRVQKDHR